MLVKIKISKLGGARYKAIILPNELANLVEYGEEVYFNIAIVKNIISLKCLKCATEWDNERDASICCPNCDNQSSGFIDVIQRTDKTVRGTK
jgi:hypothetical protein